MTTTMLIILLGTVLVAGGGVGAYVVFGGNKLKSTYGSHRGSSGAVEAESEIARIKKEYKKRRSKKVKLSLEEKMFQAGMFSKIAKAKFSKLRIIAPIVAAGVLGYGGLIVDIKYMALGAVFGVLLGLQLPFSVLDRKIKNRHEDIEFYLPLVVEQIVIGVSSSLDIGPCLQTIVKMTDERDSHNVVTELLKMVVTLSRTGLSLQDALETVGNRSGSVELKHAFAALAQVSKHGGEVTRQLQELGDAIVSQREAKLEAKLKKLELEATGPVALVFMGFFLILLTCIGLQMIKVFQ